MSINNTIMTNQSLQRTARIAGVWYALLAISGILGFLVFQPQVYVISDEVKTLRNLQDQLLIARVRLIFEILIIITQALSALWFYKLFKSIDEWSAWAVGIWGMVNAVVVMISAIAMASSIDIAHAESMAHETQLMQISLLNNLIKHAWQVGGLFFGLWLIPMGYIIIRSRRMPIWLGRFLVLGGLGYILNVILVYSGSEFVLLDAMVIPATIGEFWMIGYLFIYGIRPQSEEL